MYLKLILRDPETNFKISKGIHIGKLKNIPMGPLMVAIDQALNDIQAKANSLELSKLVEHGDNPLSAAEIKKKKKS